VERCLGSARFGVRLNTHTFGKNASSTSHTSSCHSILSKDVKTGVRQHLPRVYPSWTSRLAGYWRADPQMTVLKSRGGEHAIPLTPMLIYTSREWKLVSRKANSTWHFPKIIRDALGIENDDVVRVSWWLTTLLHRFPTETPFEERMRLDHFDYLRSSERAQASLAEQYAGLPFEA
jgi:hypothetical protein